MKYDISKLASPKMPNLGKGTECIKLLLSQASVNMHEPLVPMFFPVLGAHISGAEFQYPDFTWKELCGMMANLVGDSGCNKGQLSYLVEAICRDFRQHDEAELNVNGPGEMADADYGYVGAGRGRVSLYRRKECVLKNIPQEEAVNALLDLIEHDQHNEHNN